MGRVAVAVVLTGAAATVLAGCFTTGADFSDNAESYIVESDALRDGLFPAGGTTFTEATCEDPDSRDVGETFACTATDSDGGRWEFEMEITGSTDYSVNVSRFPDTADVAGD